MACGAARRVGGARILRDTPSSASIVRDFAKRNRPHVGSVARPPISCCLERSSGSHIAAWCRKRCLPVWRYAAVGPRRSGGALTEAITFKGSVTMYDGNRSFRIVDGNALMWGGTEKKPRGRHGRSVFAAAIGSGARRDSKTIFPSRRAGDRPSMGGAGPGTPTVQRIMPQNRTVRPGDVGKQALRPVKGP